MKIKQTIAAAGLVLLTGCTAITPVEKQYSGFLGDYSGMTKVKVEDGSDAMRWIKPDLKKGQYKKIVVSPVTYFPAPRSSEQVKLETLNKISFYLTERIRQELSKSFEITEVSGPDTLNMQVAITGVSTPMEGLKVYEVIPMTLIYAGVTAVMGSRDHVTVVYVEGLLTDSVTGAEVAKGVRQGVGESLQNDKQQLDVEKVKALLNGWAVDVGGLAKKTL